MMLAMNPFAPTMLDAMMADVLDVAPVFSSRNAPPRISVNEDGAYALIIEAPGVATADLKVRVENGALKIDGETRSRAHTHVVHWTTSLPKDADVEQATVSHIDGIVKVTLPKLMPAEPIVIAVSGDAEETPSDESDATPPAYTLTLAAAGVKATDLEVVAKPDDGVLSVRGKTARTGARLSKSFRLPADADATRASATHVDGLLTLVVPKKPATTLELEAQAIKEPKTLVINESERDVLDKATASAPMEEEQEADAVMV